MEIQLPNAKSDSTNPFDRFVPIVTSKHVHHVYLTEGIDHPAEYDELIYTLNTASPAEIFHIHLNTPGGVVDSGIAIRNAIQSSKARVIAHLYGSVASAGTMIALACDDIEVTPNLSFMCHEISVSNMGGKFSDIKNMQNFYEKQFNKLSRDVYTGFLTEDEIARMHKGEELWFDGGEVKQRWDKMKEAKE